ncbi:MAG: alpha/beta hydrolase, partial [Treponema sp.]|nr:alpha/beta hydrolase [Treponema sp.]
MLPRAVKPRHPTFYQQPMRFTITPYTNNSPMALWHALSANAFCLKDSARPAESIFYYDTAPSGGGGSTPRAVFVLLHGLGDEADTWRHILPLVSAAGCRALAPDLPGFGRSVSSGRISLSSYAAAVARFVEAVVLPGAGNSGTLERPPVFLVGSSMGAIVAEAAALHKPELASGLILMGASIPGGPGNRALFALIKRLFRRKWYRSYRKDPDGAWRSLAPYYADV